MSETYFLTGALGCIGAWVTRTLMDRGDDVVVFDQAQEHRRLSIVMEPEAIDRVRFVQGDVTDAEDIRNALHASGARRVIHLAGLQVPTCRNDPARGAMVNVVGTLNVFEASANCGVERIVYASSAAVYGPEGDETPDERAPCIPRTHYGVFKQANEGNARVYLEERGLSSVGLRPLTVYGPGRDQGLTSGPTRAMKAAVAGEAFEIGFSGPTDYQFVADTAATFVAASDRAPAGAHVWNLHGETADLAAIIDLIKARRPGAAITYRGPEIPIPPQLDGSAVHRAIPGLPITSLEEGVTRTMDHFQHLLDDGRLDTADLAS